MDATALRHVLAGAVAAGANDNAAAIPHLKAGLARWNATGYRGEEYASALLDLAACYASPSQTISRLHCGAMSERSP